MNMVKQNKIPIGWIFWKSSVALKKIPMCRKVFFFRINFIFSTGRCSFGTGEIRGDRRSAQAVFPPGASTPSQPSPYLIKFESKNVNSQSRWFSSSLPQPSIQKKSYSKNQSEQPRNSPPWLRPKSVFFDFVVWNSPPPPTKKSMIFL